MAAAGAELTRVADVTPCIDTAEDLDNRMADLTSNIKEQLEFIKKVANESVLSASAFIHFMMKKIDDAKSERDKVDKKLQTIFDELKKEKKRSKQLIACKKQRSDLKKKLSSLRSALNSSKMKEDKCSKAKSSAMKTIKELESGMNNTRLMLNATQTEHQILEAQCDAQSNELKHLNSSNARTVNELAQSRGELSTCRARYSAIIAEHDRLIINNFPEFKDNCINLGKRYGIRSSFTYGSHCYTISSAINNVPDSISACKLLGGYLVEIDDSHEHDRVNAEIKKSRLYRL